MGTVALLLYYLTACTKVLTSWVDFSYAPANRESVLQSSMLPNKETLLTFQNCATCK